MSQVARIERDGGEQDRLRRTVGEILSAALGRPEAVRHLDCSPSRFASRVPAEVLSVILESGERMSLFLKHPGWEEADHPDKQVRDREIRIYEEVFTEPGLPVARFFGWRRNDRLARREVFLEYVEDWDLRYQDITQWFTAARRLGQLHAQFGRQVSRLLRYDFLLRFDTGYFRKWAERAHAVVAEQFAELGWRLERLVEDYDRLARLLGEQPGTLVHNDLSAKNVVIERSSEPARVCFVDWEMAGTGCGLLDLVTLKYGLDPLSDQRMCEAYYLAVEESGLIPSSREELDRVVAACHLHKIMVFLWRNRVWQLPIERVAAWVAEAEDLVRRI